MQRLYVATANGSFVVLLFIFLLHIASRPSALALNFLIPEKIEQGLGYTCLKNDDCSAIQNAVCVESVKKCMCSPSYSQISATVCGRKLGDECDYDSCHVVNSRCDHLSNRCVCEDGLTTSVNKTLCYGQPLLYGDPCDHDANCTLLGENMICSKHSCVCRDNFIRHDATCKEKLTELGAKCNAFTHVCYEEGENDFNKKRQCLDGICKCRSQYIHHNEKCKEKISLLGAPCNETSQACYLVDDVDDEQKLHCWKGICQCNGNYVLHEGRCKKRIVSLHTNCHADNDVCFTNIDTNENARSCINGTCQCNEAFVEEGSCKIKISLLGAYCNASSHVCYSLEDGENQRMECKNGMCQCKNEFKLQNTKCETRNFSSRASLVLFLNWEIFLAAWVVSLRR